MVTDWRWPKRSVVLRDRNTTELFCVDPKGNMGVTRSYNVDYEAAEDHADNHDYRFFLLLVWIGGLVYLALAVLGVWKIVEIAGLV